MVEMLKIPICETSGQEEIIEIVKFIINSWEFTTESQASPNSYRQLSWKVGKIFQELWKFA